jgi:ribosomal protein S18 acetylase RimI-like enzyme
LDDAELDACLREARAGRLALVYWRTHTGRCPTTALLRQYRGSLVDRRVTYAATLAGTSLTLGGTSLSGAKGVVRLPVSGTGPVPFCESRTRRVRHTGVPPIRIAEHPCGSASNAMKRLAIAAGDYSRFAVDPRFPAEAFQRLYETWIERSARREIAHVVLTALAGQDDVLGLVTIATAVEKCCIGLIAVDEAHRGAGVGRALMVAAQQWMQQHGGQVATVVTQADNVPACRLYEHCGYHVVQQDNTFHFWCR